ncbi:NAD-dependent epimerase/dehydratase family protein [Oscillibacter valericigenes]|nr:NAD-dependent epimerase/dehydratase family protein [Oscillibacter valericigenes]
MKTILVLGANGFIGSHLVSQLLVSHRVVGYGSRPTSVQPESEQYHYIYGDFLREQNFEQILRTHQITDVYHLISTTTPKIGTAHAERELQENLLPTIRLLEAAVACGIKRIIFPSSGGTVYGEYRGRPHREEDALLPTCSYGVQKMTVEAYLRLYAQLHGLDAIIARIGNPYGCCMQEFRAQGVIPVLIRALKKGRKITLYGDTVRDYVFIGDVTDALVRLLDYTGNQRIFNIASGQGTRLYEVVKLVEAAAGKTFPTVEMEEIRSCDVAESILDISRAEQELGWAPQVSLPWGIELTCQRMTQLFRQEEMEEKI